MKLTRVEIEPSVWQFNFFGGLRASNQERVVERFRTQKTAALLALLALRGGRSREDVCALLWPDAAPEASRNSLSAALSALRRDLGEDIVRADRTSVSLAPALFQTDVAFFNDALKSGDLARAVELYRGHLLPGFHEDPFPSLEREYEEKARTAFKTRLEELEENGQSTELLELARRAVTLFGDDERWFLALMRGHYGLGDLDAALRAYDSLGRFMRKNGDTASESARVLAKLIRRDKEREAVAPPTSTFPRRAADAPQPVATPRSSATTPPPPAVEDDDDNWDDEAETTRNNLPTQWTRFFGREDERSLLRTWLSDGQKMVTLSGAGGSGKTRLALETLRELATEWEGDIVYVPLAPLFDPDLILPAIRDALQLAGTPDLSPLEQIERTLRGRRALLFLDNFEQLVEGGAARLQSLRERLPQTTFLVTSRVLLQLPGEREFPVAPLPTPLRNTAPAQVRECASAALFCDRSGLVIDASNAEAVGALCRRLDGIPLALELAAARAKVLSPAQILERLQKHPDFLQSRELGVPARHKTLRATIEWSTDLLPPDLREFWTRLSLFHGGWTLDAAEKIAAPGICEDWETLDWLTLLRECSLIFTEESGDSSRFRMLQTLREFGREQLQRTAEVEHAFFDFYLGLAQQAASAMQGPGQTAWLARLDAEQDNLRAALTYARDAEPERGLLLATALIDFWETRLSLDEGRGWIETFLKATATGVEKPPTPAPKSVPVSTPAAPTPPAASGQSTLTTARVRALSGAGRLASHSVELDESRALVEQGLEVARQSGDASNLVYAISSFVRFAMTTGDVETDMRKGRVLAGEAVQLARDTGNKTLLLEALTAHNYMRISLVELEGLRAYFQESIALARELKDEAVLSRQLSCLAHFCYHEKKWDEANALLDESTSIARRLTSTWELLEALWTRSNVARESGDLRVARTSIAEEWEICRDNPMLLWARTMNMTMIAYLRIREGDPVSAVRVFGSEEVARKQSGSQMAPIVRIDYKRYCDEALRILGQSRFEALWAEGRSLSPVSAVDAALYGGDARDTNALTAARARALSGAGRLAFYASDLTEAENLLNQGLNEARRSGDSSVLIDATRSSALATTAFGDSTRARDLGRESVRLARESGDDELLLKSLLDWGFAEVNVSDFLAAETICLEAISLARREGKDRSLAIGLSTLAIAYNYLHRYDEARELVAESREVARREGMTLELIVGSALFGHINSIQGQHATAREAYREAIELTRESLANTWTGVNVLLSASYSFFRRGDVCGCVRIIGACESLAQNIGYEIMPFFVPDYEHFRSQSRQVLGEAEWNRIWNEGRALSPEQIIDFILQDSGEVLAGASTPLSTRSRALSGAGRLAWYDGDFELSRTLANQSLEAARKSGDTASFVHAVAAFVRLSSVSGDIEGDIEQGRILSEEAVRLSRAANDESLLAESLISLTYANMIAGQLAGVESLLEEAVSLTRKLGDELQLATALVSQATLDYHEERFAKARQLLVESIAINRRLNSPFGLFASLWCESHAAREEGDLAASQSAVIEVLELCRDNSALHWNVFNVILSASFLLVRRGDVSGGVEVMSAADTLSERVGYKLVPLLLRDFDRYLAEARQSLNDTAFANAWEAGKKQTLFGVIGYVIDRLTRPAPTDPQLAVRARALSGAGRLAWHDSDFEKSRLLVEQGLEAARTAGDTASFVHAVAAFVRWSTITGDIEGHIARGRTLSEEAVRLCRAQDDEALLAEALISLAFAAVMVGSYEGMREVHSEAIELARKTGDDIQLVTALVSFASMVYHQGQLAESRDLLVESTAVCRRLNLPFYLFSSLWNTSNAAREQGDFVVAKNTILEALELCRDNAAFRWNTSNGLLGASYLLVRRGDSEGAVQLMSAALSLGAQVGYQLVPALRLDYERYRALAHQILGEEGFLRAWEQGETFTPNQALDFAAQRLNEPTPPSPAPDPLQATRARALSGAGRLAWYASDMERAGSLLRQGLDAARKIGDTEGIVYATRGLMRTLAMEGESAQASQLAHDSLELARSSGDVALLIKSLLDQGFADLNIGDVASALVRGTEATTLARQIGDESSLSLALNISAIALAHSDRDQEALDLMAQSEEVARRVGSVWDVQVLLANKGRVLSRLGQHAAAQAAFNECFALCRDELAESWSATNTFYALGYCFIRRGDVRDGVQLIGAAEAMRGRIGYSFMPIMLPDHEEALTIVRQTLDDVERETLLRRGAVMTLDEVFNFAIRSVSETAPATGIDASSDEIRAARARALSGAGRLAWYASDMEQANALLEQGLNASREIGDTEGIVYATRGLTRTAAATGDSVKSRDVAREALELARASGDSALLIKALVDQAFADINVGELSSATSLTSEAIALSRQIGDETALSLALNIGAIALSYQDRDAQALPLIRQSEEVARRIGSTWDLLVVLSLKGHSLSRLKQHNAAQEAFNECLTLCRESFSESWTVANCLLATAYSFLRRGEVRDGIQIMGAAEAMRERIGHELMPVMVSNHEQFVASARQTLGEAEFAAALQRGASMSPGEIFDFAIRPLSPATEASAPTDELALARSRALSGAGRLAWHGSDFEASRSLVEQGLNAARQSGDLTSFVYAVAAYVRFAMVTGDTDGYMAQARVLSEEAVERSRRAGDKALLLNSLGSLAYAHIIVSRFGAAHAVNQEAIALARELGDETRLVNSLNNQASVYFQQGILSPARTLLEESIPRCRGLNSTWDLIAALWTYSGVVREQGDLDLAESSITEVMELCRANPSFRWGIYNVLLTMSYLIVSRGIAQKAVQLMAAGEALCNTLGYALVPVQRPEYERYKSRALAMLGQAAFDDAWQQGLQLSPEAAMDLALRRDEATSPAPGLASGQANTAPDSTLAARARALSGAGRLAWHDSDLNASRALVDEGLEAARQSGDLASFVYAVAAFVRASMVTEESAGLIAQARLLSYEAVERSRRAGDKALLLDSLISLGYATCVVAQMEESVPANEEAIAIARELGDEANLARALTIQIGVYYHRNQPLYALVLLEECVEISRRLNSTWDLIAALWLLSGVLRQQGELEQSGEAIAEVLELCAANPNYRWNVAHVLMMVSYLFIERGASLDAVCLMAASEAISDSVGYRPTPNLLPEFERYKAKALELLGQEAFQQAWNEGRILSAESAISFALNQEKSTRSAGSSTSTASDEILAARSRALSGAGRLASQGSDTESSRILVEQALEAARQSGDTASFVSAVSAYVRFSMITGDSQGVIAKSRLLGAEAVERARLENDKALLLEALIFFGYATCMLSRFKESHAASEEAVRLARELGDDTNLVRALNNQVNIYYHQGIYLPARIILEETEELSRRLGSPADLISSLWGLSTVAREQDEPDVAEAAMIEILEICRANSSYRWGISNILVSTSYLFIKRDDPADAIRLMAAASAIDNSQGYRTIPVLLIDLERYKTQALAALGRASFDAIWQEGLLLSIDAAIELALHLKKSPSQPDPESEPPASKTLSEEVLAARSRALSGAGRLAWHNNDLESSGRLVQEGLDAARESGDLASFVYAVAAYVRFAMVTGDITGLIAQSRLLSEEAVTRSRQAGDKALLLDSLISLGYSTSIVSQFRESYAANEEAMALARELGDETSLVRVLNNQGTVYYCQGMYAPARMVLEESEQICRRLNSTWDLIAARWTLSSVAREQGNLDLADESISEVLRIYRATPSILWGGTNVLLTASYLFVRRDDAHTAVRLMSAAESILESLGYHLVPVLATDYERYQTQAREMLSRAEFASAWEEGHLLTPEAAIDLALQR